MTALPLHPGIVHLPLGLAFVVPFLALGLAWALWRGRLPRPAWLILVGLQALLVLGAFVALKTGEREEDRVERVVGEALIVRHEALATTFTWTAATVLALAVTALFLREGQAARWLRAAVAAASFVALALAIRVGHAGGELVYRHGAASAYVPAPTAGPPAVTAHGEPEEEH